MEREMKNLFGIYLHVLSFIGFSAYAEDLANEWFATPWDSKSRSDAAHDYLQSIPRPEIDPDDIEEMQRRSEAFAEESRKLVDDYGYDFRIPWYEQPDGSSALLATPDGMMDRMFR